MPESVRRQSSSGVFEVSSGASLASYEEAIPAGSFDTQDIGGAYSMEPLRKELKVQTLQAYSTAPAASDVTAQERKLYERMIDSLENDKKELQEQLQRKEGKIEELTAKLFQEKENQVCDLKRKTEILQKLEKEKIELKEKLIEKECREQELLHKIEKLQTR